MPSQRLTGPWLVLAVGVGAALLAVVVGQVRLGGYVLAASLGALAVLRLTLPVRAVGAVAVRSRGVDVLGLSLTAIGAAVLTYSLKLSG